MHQHTHTVTYKLKKKFIQRVFYYHFEVVRRDQLKRPFIGLLYGWRTSFSISKAAGVGCLPQKTGIKASQITKHLHQLLNNFKFCEKNCLLGRSRVLSHKYLSEETKGFSSLLFIIININFGEVIQVQVKLFQTFIP